MKFTLVKGPGRGRPSHALKCPECGDKIKSKKEMRLHQRTVHRIRVVNNEERTCEVCQAKLPSRKSYMQV